MSELKSKIWLSSPHLGGSENKYIQEAFDSNWISPLGAQLDAFEQSLANRLSLKYCVALNSGTAGIHLALIMLGVSPGDLVICQSLTFVASANPIVYLGATPVFIDSEPDTWNMDPVLLEAAILKLQDDNMGVPKAIIVVHIYGMPAKMDEILEIGKKYCIPVIEDAAEALGSMYDGRPVGSMGVMGLLSFNGNKIITTSAGGALLSDDKDLIDKALFLSTQARDKAPHYQHSQVGYNYRMSNILAAIGRGQLDVLDDRIEQRRRNNQYYRKMLSEIPGISFHTEPSGKYHSIYWLTAITINPEITGEVTREHIRIALKNEDIEARPVWKPLGIQPVFSNYPYFSNGFSQKLSETGLCLPSGSNMSDEDLERVVKLIRNVLTGK
jgi:dTDP-4-amino-4,6-dideoxygalactose transaminase